MNTILISILIPVYNVEKYLNRCLDHLLIQINEDDCEIIIVDDGSTDCSGKICDEYKSKHSKIIKVYHKANEGAYPTRNYALDRSSGKYVWLIDPDDYIQDYSIEEIRKILQGSQHLDVVSMAYKCFSGTTYSELKNVVRHNYTVSGKDFLKDKAPDPYLWSKIYNRDFLLKSGIRFNDKLNTQGDWLFNITVFIKAQKIICTNIYAYNYFQGNPTSTLRNPDKKHRIRGAENSILAVLEYKKLIEQNNNKEIEPTLRSLMSLILAGFLFSLYRFRFNTDFIANKIEILHQNGLYPVQKCNYNRKANLFLFFANKKTLFLLSCRIRKAFKNK